MGEITVVTMLFDIGRGEDKNLELRKSSEKYLNAFKHWASIQNKLVVYTDPQNAKKIMEIRESFGRGEQTVIIEIDNLFDLEGDLFKRMEKAAAHPDFLNFRYIPEAFSNNPKYDYLWMMKYYFMNDAYNRGLLSEQVAWVDICFDQGGTRYYSEDFDFKWEYDFGDKIHVFCLYSPDSVLGIETLQYLDDCVEGNMYGLPKKRVPDFWQLVRNAMEALLMLDCVDDDQLLVMMAYKARPDLFKIQVADWSMGMKLCGGDHMRLKPKREYKQENKYKKMLRLAFRKISPNKKDPKRLYAKRCYDKAVRFYGK